MYGLYPEPAPEPEPLMPRPSLEGIEYECRQRMAAVARHQVRGFDSAKEHRRLLGLVDESLDLYNLAQEALS